MSPRRTAIALLAVLLLYGLASELDYRAATAAAGLSDRATAGRAGSPQGACHG